MSMFYNHFFKQEFISQYEGETQKTIIKSLFKKSKSLEEAFDKDLYNFTDKELELLLYAFQSPSKNTISTYLNFIRKYIDYSIEKGNRISNINLARLFTYDKLEKYLYKYKLKFLDRDRMEVVLESLYNDNDKAVIWALFFGINGKEYGELANLTLQDIKDAYNNPTKKINNEQYYAINLKNEISEYEIEERTMEIPRFLLLYFKLSYGMTDYPLKNGEASAQQKKRMLMKGEHIFRNMEHKRQTTDKIDKQFVYRKLKLINEVSNSEISSVTTIINSGIVYQLYINAKNGVATEETYAKAAEHFNIPLDKKSASYTYKKLAKKYKDILLSSYGVESQL